MGGVAYSTPIAKALDDAAADDKIKAVVLRVDSPGGSAVASEIILNASKRVAAKKPLGGVDGQCGRQRWILCRVRHQDHFCRHVDHHRIDWRGGRQAGDRQDVGDESASTGHPIRRGANAGMLDSGDMFTDEQRELLQGWMNEIYEVFKGHVVAIRGDKLAKKIDELAGGRVYTGKQALDLGLVDKLGGLEDAIAFAAKEANITEYDIRILPQPKSFIEVLLSDLQDGDEDNKTLVPGAAATGRRRTRR